MKKMLSVLLSAILCISCFMKPASADAEKVVVSFDTIEKIMLENSPDLQKIKADLEKAKGDYSEWLQNVDDLKAKNAVLPDSDLTIQYNTAKINRDSTQIVYLTRQMQYDKNVMLKVLDTQTLYLTYLADLRQIQVSSVLLENKNQEIKACETKLNLGLITHNEYHAAQLALRFASDDLSSSRQKAESDIRSLKTTLGLDESAEMDILPAGYDVTVIPLIPSIDYDADSAEMLLNNVDIRAKETELRIRQEAVIRRKNDIAVTETELKQAKDNALKNFRGQYDALMNAYRNYETATAALEVSRGAAETGRILYQYGYCSELRLNELELNESMAQLEETAQKDTLYITYLRYIQMKGGN